MKDLAVLGSLNTDIIVRVDALPLKGETVKGKYCKIRPGGKGLNQAVDAKFCGSKVTMYGKIGNDAYGHMLLVRMKEANVINRVEMVDDVHTGIAAVTSSKDDNCIVVVSGANALVDVAYLDSIKEELIDKVVLCQAEIPLETVYALIRYCKEKDICLVLDPSPCDGFDVKYFDLVSYVILNESEIKALFPHDGIFDVLAKYPNKMICTAGNNGAYYHDGKKLYHEEGKNVISVDTTGAGDAFHAAFAALISDEKSIKEAVEYANTIASLATLQVGAQSLFEQE